MFATSPAGTTVYHMSCYLAGRAAIGEEVKRLTSRTKNCNPARKFCLLHLPPPGRHLYAEAFLRDLFQEGLDRAGPAPEPGPSPSFKDYFGRNGALLPTLSQGRGEIFTVVRFQEGGK